MSLLTKSSHGNVLLFLSQVLRVNFIGLQLISQLIYLLKYGTFGKKQFEFWKQVARNYTVIKLNACGK